MKNDGNSILLNEVRLLRRRWKMVGENRLSVQEKQFFMICSRGLVSHKRKGKAERKFN